MPTKAHLLIVDDEANTLASLSRAFRLAGHDATVCDNATKAVELAKSQNFDLVMADGVIWAAPAVDITPQVLAVLNAGTAKPAAPAAPKPPAK